MAERKNPELDAKHLAILRKMMQRPENKTCADCKGPSPRWASTNLGIFVCIACSGIHRKLGTHISQVRSITLDTWTPSQIAHFQKRGNAKAAQYFEACLPSDFQRPFSTDAMSMERFIRDKYEKKRYITEEHGGLGGRLQSAAGAPSSFTTTQTTTTSFSRPSQGVTSRGVGSGYDNDSSKHTKATSSMSYGARFGANATSLHSRPLSTSKGTFNSQRGTSAGRTNNAFQRANTLREITNMGFSAQIAARAVEAGNGDLQRAVDWVLEQDTSRFNQFEPPAPPAPPKPKTPIMADLMDFGDPDPTPAPNTSQATKPILAQNSWMNPKPLAPVSSNSVEDDFGDFGDFESALPSSSTVQTAAPKAGTGSFSSSIASLYAKPAPAVPKAPFQVSPKARPLSMDKIPSRQSPKVSPKVLPNNNSPNSSTAQQLRQPTSAISPSKKRSPVHAEFPKFEWPSDVKIDTKKSTPQQIPPVTLTPTQPSSMTKPSVTSSVPPPPPPPVGPVSVVDPNTGPPPPSDPPPVEASNGLEEQETIEKADVPPAENGENKEAEKSEVVEEPEEEDPFAALSMFALQSAISSKKSSKPKENQTNLGDMFSTGSARPDVSGSTGINLDELLG